MAKINGSVDNRQRPVVRLESGKHSLLLLVDTGFNGDLLLSEPAARALAITGIGRMRTIDFEARSVEIGTQ